MTHPSPKPTPAPAPAQLLHRLQRMNQQLDQLLLAAANPHYRR